MRSLLMLLAVGCAAQGKAPTPTAPIEQEDPRAIEEEEIEPAPSATPKVAERDVDAERPYPADISSVRLRKRTSLRKSPRGDAPIVGIIKKDALAGFVRAAPGGDDCTWPDGEPSRWIELAPRGWACETALEPSRAQPPEQAQVSIEQAADATDGRPVRGVYGMVRKRAAATAFASEEDALAGVGRPLTGSNTVRSSGKVTIDGRKFWRTTSGELIDATAISYLSPSKFRGHVISDAARMPAWIRSARHPKEPVRTRAEPGKRAKVTGELPARTIVDILERSPDGDYVRVGERAWVARADVRISSVAAPPPGTQPDERWFDIDLDEQVLVAYEGAKPVFATLVSTGKRKHRTPTAIARVGTKLEHAVMDSEKESYSVADVPWTMYYDGDYALHTSYWHDGFGGPRSHGCINLAPADARLLYHWSSPDVPAGWTVVYGDADHPGSLVRVRSAERPTPGFRGYARELFQRSTGDVALAR